MPRLTASERRLELRLRALLELLPAALDREVASAGITSFEHALLQTLADSEEGQLRLSVLARETNATLPRLSRVMTALERKGLVERSPDPLDARATRARLTSAGEASLREARPLMEHALHEIVVEPLGPGGVEDLSDHLAAILRRLDPDGRLAVTAAPDVLDVDDEGDRPGG